MWPNKLVLRQLKTDIDLMDTGWVKRKIQSIWWHQMGVMSTAGSQHTWVKRGLQGDLLLWIRFKHLPSLAAGCSSSWKLFLHADMWVLIGQFGAGKFKPLLNNAILIIHSRTAAVQTSSWFCCFLNLVYYELKWDVRSFVFISTWFSLLMLFRCAHTLIIFFFLATISLAQMPTN